MKTKEQFLEKIKSDNTIENLMIDGLELSEQTFLKNDGNSTFTFKNVIFKNVNFRSIQFINFEFIDCVFQKSVLNNVNLTKSILKGCEFIDINFKWSIFTNTDFDDCVFFKCDFGGFSKFIGCNFTNSDISETDLSYCALFSSTFKNIKFSDTDFFKTYFNNPVFENIKTNTSVRFFHQQCPTEGSFIGYVPMPIEKTIVKIRVTEDSKRSSGTSYLCRCSRAEVIEILDIKGLPTEKTEVIYTNRDVEYQMKVGDIVETKEFDNNRWERGKYSEIEFYMNIENAMKHQVYLDDEDGDEYEDEI